METVLLLAGAVVSVLVAIIKAYFGTTGWKSMAAGIGLSLVGGAAFYFLKMFGLWDAVLQILITAGAFYAFIIRNLPTAE